MRVYSGNDSYREASRTEKLIFSVILVYAACAICILVPLASNVTIPLAGKYEKWYKKRKASRCNNEGS